MKEGYNRILSEIADILKTCYDMLMMGWRARRLILLNHVGMDLSANAVDLVQTLPVGSKTIVEVDGDEFKPRFFSSMSTKVSL